MTRWRYCGRVSSFSQPQSFYLHSEATPMSGVTVYVTGEIDMATQPALTECLTAHLESAARLARLVVDLSAVTFIDGRGLTALINAAGQARRTDTAFSVSGASPAVLRLVQIVGAGDMVDVVGRGGPLAGHPLDAAATTGRALTPDRRGSGSHG